jgi:hypothetical protein
MRGSSTVSFTETADFETGAAPVGRIENRFYLPLKRDSHIVHRKVSIVGKKR